MAMTLPDITHIPRGTGGVLIIGGLSEQDAQQEAEIAKFGGQLRSATGAELVVFLQQGQTLESLPADLMRAHGWVKVTEHEIKLEGERDG